MKYSGILAFLRPDGPTSKILEYFTTLKSLLLPSLVNPFQCQESEGDTSFHACQSLYSTSEPPFLKSSRATMTPLSKKATPGPVFMFPIRDTVYEQ